METNIPDELSFLSDGKVYKQFPERYLGEKENKSTRFGGIAEVCVGNVADALARIPFTISKSTSVKEMNKQIENSLNAAYVEATLEKTNKTDKPKRPISVLSDSGSDVVSFEECFQLLNAHLTEDEIVAYLYFREHTLNDPFEGKWKNLKVYHSAKNLSATELARLVKNEVLYFDGANYYPGFVFLTGDISTSLANVNANASKIKSTYGEAIFQNTVDRLLAAKPKQLTLDDENKEIRIAINLHSDFAAVQRVRLATDDAEEGEYFSLREAFKIYLNQLPRTRFTDVTAYEIIHNYILIPVVSDKLKDEERLSKIQLISDCKKAGIAFLEEFLAEGINASDRVQIEKLWNAAYNNVVAVDFMKVPVAFEYAKTYMGDKVEIRAEKREAVAFLVHSGAGILAYDVGVGKTWAATFALGHFLDAGMIKRPAMVTPKGVLGQFVKEFQGLQPTRKVNNYGNLGVEYASVLDGDKVKVPDAGSVTFMSYEGFKKFAVTRDPLGETFELLLSGLLAIIRQETNEKASKRKAAKEEEAAKDRLGEAAYNREFFWDEAGFDFLGVDEAHSARNVFTSVKKDSKEQDNSQIPAYQIQGKSPSAMGLTVFFVSQYLNYKYKRNVMLLTATPFTNSPLEVYSMLAIVGYNNLVKMGINNIRDFFDTYARTSTEYKIDDNLNFKIGESILGWNNLMSMGQLIKKHILYKTGEDVGVVRPNKIVLPLKSTKIGKEIVALPKSEQILTLLSPSPLQEELFSETISYSQGLLGDIRNLCVDTVESLKESLEPDSLLYRVCADFVSADDFQNVNEDPDPEDKPQAAKSVRILKSIGIGKQIAFSPYLHICLSKSSLMPTPQEFVEDSPKIAYAIECIRTVKAHHEKAGTAMSGQVVYSNVGVDFFPMIKQYLVNELGFASREVEILDSSASTEKRESIKDRFNNGQIHVLICSPAAREGINLQKRASVLYMLTLDWNPTDVKQLEGRIWRQGNIFENVRIVIPLVSNSMDAFVMQKVYEKTQRINEIWASDGKVNMLKLDEFNPEELRFEMITNPETRAKLELDEDLKRLHNKVKRAKEDFEEAKSWEEGKKVVAKKVEYLKDYIKELDPQNIVEIAGLEPTEVLKLYRKKVAAFKSKNKANPEYSFLVRNKTIYEYELNQIRDTIYQYTNLTKQLFENGKRPKTDEEFKIILSEKYSRLSSAEKNLSDFNYEQKFQEKTEIYKKKIAEESKSIMTPVEAAKAFARLNHLLDKTVAKNKPKPDAVAALINEKVTAQLPPRLADGTIDISPSAIDFLEEELAKLPETKSLHFNSERNEYSEPRKALHKRIKEHYTGHLPCEYEQPIAVFTGGLPGSGKTTFIKKAGYDWLLNRDIALTIDADSVRDWLPEYEGYNATNTHREVRDIVDSLIGDVANPCKYNLVYDGTMKSWADYTPMIARFKKSGYKTFVIFLVIDPKISRKRVLERYQRGGKSSVDTNKTIHRYVPRAVIDKAAEMGTEPIDRLKSKVDGYLIVDGLTGNILEKGGIELPKTVTLPKAKQEPVLDPVIPPSNKKQITTKLIKSWISAIEVSLEFLKDEDLTRAKNTLSGYKDTYKIFQELEKV